MKEYAIDIIFVYLEKAGLSEGEIIFLPARFMEEEAQNFIDAVDYYDNNEKVLN